MWESCKVTWGWSVVSTRFSGFINNLWPSFHKLAWISIIQTPKSEFEYDAKGDLRFLWVLLFFREIHPLDPQPHRHSMLVPRWCAPWVTRCCLGKNWSRDFFQQAAGSQSCGTQVVYDSYSRRQRNLMTHAQCPLPVYYCQVFCNNLQTSTYDLATW